MIITTTDPITGELLLNLQAKPYVIEGSGALAVKIYFESESTRRTYLETHQPELVKQPGELRLGTGR